MCYYSGHIYLQAIAPSPAVSMAMDNMEQVTAFCLCLFLALVLPVVLRKRNKISGKQQWHETANQPVAAAGHRQPPPSHAQPSDPPHSGRPRRAAHACEARWGPRRLGLIRRCRPRGPQGARPRLRRAATDRRHADAAVRSASPVVPLCAGGGDPPPRPRAAH
jgi:hypothetical protein